MVLQVENLVQDFLYHLVLVLIVPSTFTGYNYNQFKTILTLKSNGLDTMHHGDIPHPLAPNYE